MANDIAVDQALWENVEKNIKRITIRKGHRDYQPDENVVLYCTQYPELKEEVTLFTVDHCLANEVSLQDLIDDGFEDHDDFYRGMKEYYPDFGPETEVTVITW